MACTVLRKGAYLLLVLLCISFLSFVLANIAPIDPAEAYAKRMDKAASEETIQQTREALGFSQPMLQQYGVWLGKVIRLDFGSSYITGKPVLSEITHALPLTMFLALCAALFILILSLPLGIVSAWRVGTIWDKIIGGFAFLTISAPSYFVGLLFLLLFGMYLQWFPLIGHGNPVSLICAAFVLALPMVGALTRVMRSLILEERGKDYILYAKARGIPSREILLRHLLRNAAPACVTLFGQNIGYLIAGTSIVETIFSASGLGQYAINAALNRDFPVINGYIVLMALFFVLFNLAAEIIGTILNPGLRRGMAV